MPKALELTPKIRELIASATDGETDPETVAVYESISLNTLPINKKFGLFQGAVHAESTLNDMANVASARPLVQHIPVHIMHDTYTLPVGKVFHAELVKDNGLPELRSLFYVSKSEPGLVAKVEDGSIAEVSVGLGYKHINCSQCGFDYMADDTTMEQIWDQTCSNGHEIGKDGVHAILNGLDTWMEQSLVGRGAAQNPKILGRAKSLLGAEKYSQLAASGRDPRATLLFASATPLPPKENDMDLTTLLAQLGDTTTKLALAQADVTRLTAENATLKGLETKLAEVNAEIATLKSAEPAKLQEQVTAAQAEAKLALEHTRKEADRLCVASATEKLPATATLVELQASIDSNRTKLTATFGGHRVVEEPNTGSNKPSARNTSFKLTA